MATQLRIKNLLAILCIGCSFLAHAEESKVPEQKSKLPAVLPPKLKKATLKQNPFAGQQKNETAFDEQSVTETWVKPDETEPPSADLTSYPYGALYESYKEEFSAQKKTKEEEQRAAKARAEYENKKAEIDREISVRRQKIFELKASGDDAKDQVRMMETELESIAKQQKEAEESLATIAKKSDEILNMADSRKKELNDSKIKLLENLDQLKSLRERTQKNFYRAKIQIQRIESEIAVLDTETTAIEVEVHNVQSAEIKAKAEWLSLRGEVEKHRGEKNKANQMLADARAKLNAALKDLSLAKADLMQAEKDKNQTEMAVNAEVRKLEESTSNAIKTKAYADVERVKLDSEVDKLKLYGDTVRRTNKDTLEAMRNSQYDLMESRLSLESFKSSLIKETANDEKMKLENQKSAIKERNLASVLDQKQVLNDGKKWSFAKECPVYKRANSKSETITRLPAGEKVLATKFYGKWIKVMTAGTVGYSYNDCGQFEQ